MLEVAADASAVCEHILSAHGRAGEVVAKCDIRLYPITDRLYAGPSWLGAAEKTPSGVHQPVNLTITRSQQVAENLRGEIFDGRLAGSGIHQIRFASVFDQR